MTPSILSTVIVLLRNVLGRDGIRRANESVGQRCQRINMLKARSPPALMIGAKHTPSSPPPPSQPRKGQAKLTCPNDRPSTPHPSAPSPSPCQPTSAAPDPGPPPLEAWVSGVCATTSSPERVHCTGPTSQPAVDPIDADCPFPILPAIPAQGARRKGQAPNPVSVRPRRLPTLGGKGRRG